MKYARCENRHCRQRAVYEVNVKDLGSPCISYVRKYCEQHTRALVAGVAQIVGRSCAGHTLHEYIEIEHVNVQAS